jgi:hypothetical protein
VVQDAADPAVDGIAVETVAHAEDRADPAAAGIVIAARGLVSRAGNFARSRLSAGHQE